MSNTRRPGHIPVLTPDYDDEVPVANKITIAPKTKNERTILLHRPVGKENRRKMAKVYPIVGKLEEMAVQIEDGDSLSARISQTRAFANLIADLWQEQDFEDEILPFVLQVEPEYLETLELPDLIAPFMKAVRYLAAQESTEELKEALKKSPGENGAKVAQDSPDLVLTR